MTIKNNQLEDSPRITSKVGSDPSPSATQGAFFPKDVAGVVEGFYIDNQGRTIQITNDGNLKVPSSLVGEVNTASNAGSLGEGLALTKQLYDLPFKRLKAGQNITLNPQSTYIEIIANFPPSQGEANTASNIGLSGVGIYKQKTGVNLELRRLKAGNNVTITQTINDEILIESSGGGGGGSGDMSKSTYDTNNDGIVDNSTLFNSQNASYYLSRSNHTGTQSAGTISGLASVAISGTLASLSDAQISSPTNNQVLQWNGTKWINATLSAGSGDMLKSIYDTNNNGIVDNSTQLNGQSASFYLSRANHTGTQAANTITGLANIATTGNYSDLATKPALNNLTDVNAGSPTNGQVLTWNSGTSRWIASTVAGSGDMTKAAYDSTNTGNSVDNALKLNNQLPAFYLSRANHTGTQLAATISDLASVATVGTLGSLSNVNASSPSNGQALTWDSGTSRWIASTISGGGGGLVRYQADATTNEEVWVLATGSGITYSRSGSTGTFVIPSGVQLVSARLRLPMATIGGTSFTVVYGSGSGNGAGDNTSAANAYRPTLAAWREDSGSAVAITSSISAGADRMTINSLASAQINQLKMVW